jgi:predicted DNA-binding transcriptional regulator AlpA
VNGQPLVGRRERVRIAEASAITGVPETALLAAAQRGEIPGAGKPLKSWTFDVIRLCDHFNKSIPDDPVYHLDNLGSRGLDREQAMQHLGLTGEDFDLFVTLGRIPRPLTIGDRTVWPKQNLVVRKRQPRGEAHQYAGVYVIGFSEYIKIGMSANVTDRLAAIQDWLPVKMTVHQIFVTEGRRLELDLHHRFSEYRLRGEWFRLEGRLAAWIETGCR